MIERTHGSPELQPLPQAAYEVSRQESRQGIDVSQKIAQTYPVTQVLDISDSQRNIFVRLAIIGPAAASIDRVLSRPQGPVLKVPTH